MRLREEFRLGCLVAEVWSFVDQPRLVAECMPGVEDLSMSGPDELQVRVTQSVGPMSATFAADLTIVERVPEKRVAFTATGKTVRGAMGNVRASVTVELEPDGDGTNVVVEGDVALAGALGSVGQKVVAKQAGKVTAAFARNLEAALGGEVAQPASPVSAVDTPGHGGGTTIAERVRAAEPVPVAASERRAVVAEERWAKVAAALSAASLAVGLVALGHSMGRTDGMGRDRGTGRDRR